MNDKCSLLIVDDEVHILHTLKGLLQRDFEVLTASSGEEAIRLLRQRAVDLILADQKMPGMTGVELLEWVRKNSPQTVQLMMTGFADFEETVQAINRGQIYRIILKPWKLEELLLILHNAAHLFRLERSNERMLAELQRFNLELEQRVQQRTRDLEEVIRQLQQKNSMLERFALTDPLTGLPNRRALDGLAKFELRRRSRYPGPLAIGLIDADHFKEINTRYLLPGGDQVLIFLGRVLSSCGRSVDTVGRLGGDEFMVLAPQTTLEGAGVLGERMRLLVERSRAQYRGEPIALTISLGFAVADWTVSASYDQMKHAAAAALAEAKQQGRNRCIVRSVAAACPVAPPAPASRDDD
jgi:diguanylate cyclase (GGDEF)-like protein